jgi:hypothetical protein
MPGSLTAAKAYRDKAERFHRMADDAISLEIRIHLLEIANDYTALAEAEEVLANMPNGRASMTNARQTGRDEAVGRRDQALAEFDAGEAMPEPVSNKGAPSACDRGV